MAAVTIYSDFGGQKNEVCDCFHCFPIYLPWSDGTGSHDLSFWMLSFKPTFSLSSLTFIKRLFSSSLLSAIRVVSSAYLRLLIFLLAVLVSAWALASLAFHMMYSVYKLNKQGDNKQPWCTRFPIWNQQKTFFLKLSCFLHDSMNVGNLISDSSASSKSSLYIHLEVQVLLKHNLKDFEHYLTSMWNKCDRINEVVWTFFGIALH